MCESEPEASVFEGEDFKFSLDFKGGDEAVGVKRLIYDGGEGYQYYYFCEKAKGENKKNCGAWVDKKGNKISSATNKVTLKGKEIIISKITEKDRGAYNSIFEDPKLEMPDVRLSVGTRPPSPKS
ncbi:hypothetical protein CAEBREN_07639 [Caenorhabditis brenneri]|uniref:Uncharacterized protein n=1 Tax=Caenorhabditis brenneri TaxID=135651 RepID=G0NLQ9_CAEBE|nr:hypothetical protein CAEBREN_07639 [Caenorhabditis brenneri]